MQFTGKKSPKPTLSEVFHTPLTRRFMENNENQVIDLEKVKQGMIGRDLPGKHATNEILSKLK